MKVALCFWGLTRSLKYTIDNIQKNILQVLKRHNIQYTIFLHTYNFETTYVNPRAGEIDVCLDFEEYKLLNPTYFQIDNQDEIKSDIDVYQYRTHGDPWESEFISLDNFICAMYSKKQLGLMVKKSSIKFDYIIYLRPDVNYLHKLDVRIFNLINKYNVATPNFHLFPKLNDRFAILKSCNLEKYANMFDKMYEYSLNNQLHSERFQYYIMVKIYKWNIRYITIYFNRVRANGIELQDIPNNKYNKKKNESASITPIETTKKPIKLLFKMKS